MRCVLTIISVLFFASVFGQDTLLIKDKSADKDKNIDTAEVIDITFEPNQYYYQFDSAAGGLMANLNNGYVDTFSLKNTKFRLRAVYGSCRVEYLQSGRWRNNFQFDFTRGFEISKDINADGFNDFVNYYKWYGDVYLFIPGENKFSDSANCSTSYDRELLDTSNKIFFDVDEGKLLQPVISTLYTFNGLQRIELFELKITFKQDEDYTITDETLFRDGTAIAKIRPAKNAGVIDFNYKRFWATRYKKLLHITKN